MRVVHISSADNRGGAARSAYRLHQALQRRRVASQMFVKRKFTDDESVLEFRPHDSTLNKAIFSIRRKWETGRLGYFSINETSRLGFSPAAAPFGPDLLSQIPNADIYNLHWVSAFFDFRLLPKLVGKCGAVVWRFSDMNPFSGGCLYDNYCGRYTLECGECPVLNSRNRKDLSYKTLRLKKRVIDALPRGFLHIVVQSRWMEQCVRRSAVFRDLPITRIPNGIDTDRFRPIPCQEARKELDLPSDHAIIMFIAQSLSNPMKGGMSFRDAAQRVAAQSERPVTLLVVGSDSFPEVEGAGLMRHQTIDDLELNRLYSASDVFVITSLQDNLPNTVLEAMASGTPVVGFKVGGIPDMVEDRENGFLVTKGDVGSLTGRILKLISNHQLRQRYSARSREKAVKEFSVQTQAEDYLRLYEELVAGS